jgi:predicted transcriptional regulator YheO
MKAWILFTGSGPILTLTSFDSLLNRNLITKFKAKGIKKFIAYEVPVDLVKQKYGKHYDIVLNDLKQQDDLRVMDYNGHHVFYNFTIKELGDPIYFEE